MNINLSNAAARQGERVSLLPHVTMLGVPEHLVDRLTDFRPMAHNSSTKAKLKGASYHQTPGKTFRSDRHAPGLSKWTSWEDYQKRFAPKPPT